MTDSKSKIQNPKSALPRYDRYKDSGIEWLGEVPKHWDVRRNLGVFDERKECNQPEEELLSVTVSRGIIRQSEITAKKDSSNDDKSKYKVVRVGDLAYNKMRAWQGALGISAFNGIVSPAYVVLTPRNQNLSKYFHYLYRTPQFITEANRLSYGLCDDMNSLRYEHFKTSYSPLPPNDEIDRIVAFLDQKTAEIDALIAKKQRQIELLDEQKAILINRAVTQGLNPNAKLKPSGIEWIGEIPEHWEVLKLRRLLNNIEQGNSPNAVQDNGDPEQWKVITLSAVSKGVFRNDAFKPISSTTVQKEANTLAPGDLLLTRANTRSLVGDACIVESVLPNTTFSDLVYRFLPNSRANSKYLLRYFLANASRSQIERDARGSNETMCKVSHGHIKEWDVALPPRNEQLDIVCYLERLDQTREGAIGSLKSQIESLKILRSTVIAHAVTGRIKV
jgi:type I restriction enzyme S subunit